MKTKLPSKYSGNLPVNPRGFANSRLRTTVLGRKLGKEKNAWSDFQRIKTMKRVNSGQTQQFYISKMKTFIYNSFALAVVSCHSVHKLHGRDSFVSKD